MHVETYKAMRRRQDRAMNAALGLALALLGAATCLLGALVAWGLAG